MPSKNFFWILIYSQCINKLQHNFSWNPHNHHFAHAPFKKRAKTQNKFHHFSTIIAVQLTKRPYFCHHKKHMQTSHINDAIIRVIIHSKRLCAESKFTMWYTYKCDMVRSATETLHRTSQTHTLRKQTLAITHILCIEHCFTCMHYTKVIDW